VVAVAVVVASSLSESVSNSSTKSDISVTGRVGTVIWCGV
jgi:hypothetical protein